MAVSATRPRRMKYEPRHRRSAIIVFSLQISDKLRRTFYYLFSVRTIHLLRIRLGNFLFQSFQKPVIFFPHFTSHPSPFETFVTFAPAKFHRQQFHTKVSSNSTFGNGQWTIARCQLDRFSSIVFSHATCSHVSMTVAIFRALFQRVGGGGSPVGKH